MRSLFGVVFSVTLLYGSFSSASEPKLKGRWVIEQQQVRCSSGQIETIKIPQNELWETEKRFDCWGLGTYWDFMVDRLRASNSRYEVVDDTKVKIYYGQPAFESCCSTRPRETLTYDPTTQRLDTGWVSTYGSVRFAEACPGDRPEQLRTRTVFVRHSVCWP